MTDLRNTIPTTRARRRGDRYDVERCPFHDDSRPSLLIWPNFWKCLAGCGSGDAADFVARFNGISRSRALSQLGEALPTSERIVVPPAPIPELDPSLGLKYHLSLQSREREYYHWRGLMDTTIDYFELGYGTHPAGGRARFTIPVYDENRRLLNIKFRSDDRCVSCHSPSTTEVIKDERIWECRDCREVYEHPDNLNAKYVGIKDRNEPRLFGAGSLTTEEHRAFICEGEFDTIMLQQQGYTAVSSTAGCNSFRASFAVQFLHIPRVYVCYDSDNGGQTGARMVVEIIPKAIVVTLPTKDISEFFQQHSRKEFEDLLSAAENEPQNCLGLRLSQLER